MCGIAGALARPERLNAHAATAAVHRMCQHMAARGPDADGCWCDAAAGVTLGHRRLAILDLDARANQPIASGTDRFDMVYNGEIYNFRELRAELQRDGMRLRTESDSEVVLELYARRGEAMLSHLRGMFAIAIWDRCTRRRRKTGFGIPVHQWLNEAGGPMPGARGSRRWAMEVARSHQAAWR